MEKKAYIIISIISLVISLVALIIAIIAFWSSCEMSYNNENAIMSTFSILVTVLITFMVFLLGWQLYKYYVAKDEVNRIIEQKVPELALDIWKVLDTINKSQEDTFLLATNDVADYQKIEIYIRSLEIAKGCSVEYLKEYGINYVLDRFVQFYKYVDEEDGMHIYKGKKEEYMHVCENINHRDIWKLRYYILNATEVTVIPEEDGK